MRGMDRRLTDLVQPATREEEVGLVQEVANDELAQLSLALDHRVVKSVIGGRLREEIIVSRTLDRLWALLPGLARGTTQHSQRDERKAVASGVELEPCGAYRRVGEMEVHAVVELRELARSDDRERLRRRLRGYIEALADRWRERLPEGLLAEIESAARADDSEVGATLLALVALARGDAGSLIELALGQQSIGPIVAQLVFRLARGDTSSRNGPDSARRHALPTAATASAVVCATIEDEDDLCLEGSAAACDGAFIYAYRRFSHAKDAAVSTETLVKLGTGLYETAAGRIYGRLELGPTKVTGTVLNSDGCFPAPVEFKRPPHVSTPSEADSIDLVCVPGAGLLVLCVSGAVLAFSTRTLMPPHKIEIPERLWINAQEDEEKEEKTSDESKQHHDRAFVRRRRRRLVGDGCEAMVADFEDANEDTSGSHIRLSPLIVRCGRLEVARAMRSLEATLETRTALAAASPAALVGNGALLVLSGASSEDDDEVPSPNSSCDSLEKRRKKRRRPQGVAMRMVENGEEEEEDWILGLADCRASFGLDDRREVYSRDISLSADSENDGHPVRNLLREDGGSWQSNGREPHRVHVQFPLVDEEKIWSRIEVRPGTMRPSLYVPNRITVFAGLKQPDQDSDTLQEYRTVTINIHDSGQTSAWHEILTRDELFAKLPCASHLESPDDKRVVIARIEFRSQGVNCKVRGLRIAREERAYRRLLWNAYPSPTGCRILTGLRALDLLAETNAPPVALAADRVNRAVWTYDGKTTCCRWLEPLRPREVDLPVDGAREKGTLLGALASLACASADFDEPFGPDVALRAERRHAVVELHDGAVATLTLDGMPAAIDVLAPSAKFPSFAAVLTIDRPTRRIISAVMDTSRTSTTHRGLLESALEDSDQGSPRFVKIIIANSAARDPAKGGALSSMRARRALSRLLAKQPRTSTATPSGNTTNGHSNVSVAFPESATSGFAAAVLYRPAFKQGGFPRKETVVAWLGAKRAAKLVVSLGPRGLAPGVLDACTDLTPRVFHKLTSKLLADSNSDNDDRTAAAWLLAAANERLSDALEVDASRFWPRETSERVINAALHNKIDFAAAGALIASIEHALPAGPFKLAVLEKNLSAAQAILGLASNSSGTQRQPPTCVSLKDVELWQSLSIEDARRLRTAVAHVCRQGINTSLFLDALRAATLARAIVAARRGDDAVSQAQDLALCLEELTSAVNAARSQPCAVDWDNTRVVHVMVATAVVVVAYGSTWAADVRQCFATAADNLSTLFASTAVSSSIVGSLKGDGNNPLDTALCDLDLALVAAAANSSTTAELTSPAQQQSAAGVLQALSSRLFQGEIVEPIPGSDAAATGTTLSTELAALIGERGDDSHLGTCEASTLRLFEVLETAAAGISGDGKMNIDVQSVRGRSLLRARYATVVALMYHLSLGPDFVAVANCSGIPVSMRLAYAWLASARILRENKCLANEQPESGVARESIAVAERAALLLTLGVHPASTAAAVASAGLYLPLEAESSSIPEAKAAINSKVGTATSITLWHRDAGGPQGTHVVNQLELPRPPLLSMASASDQPTPAPFAPSSMPKVSVANQAGSDSDRAVLNADVVSDVITFLANPDLSVPEIERERDHRAALAFSRCEALHTIAKQLRTRRGVALTNVVVLATAALRGHSFAPSRNVIPLTLAQAREKLTAGDERHASFARAEVQARENTNVTSPAHYTANTIGASRNMSGKLRAATNEVIIALLDLIRPSGTSRCCDNVTNIKVGALRALTLDYIASPVADDVMLANSGLAEILEELRDERRRNERSVVAAARDLAAQLLTPERPSTELTRSLLTVTRHALHRQATVAIALSNAVVPSEANAITGTMPIEPTEDGGFLVAPTSKIANQVLALKKAKAIIISLWLCRASSGLVFAALQSASTFSSPSGLQAEVALLFDEHGRLRWTERTQTGTISYAWRFWASTRDWVHVAVVLKERLEMGRGHCVELYLDGAKVEPAAVSTDRDDAVPGVLFSSSSMAAQSPQKYQLLFRMAECLVHAVWAVGNIQGVPATEATACVGAISRLEIAACNSEAAVTTLIDERSAKRPFYAAETADLARINYDVLGDALRILRSRSRSNDVLPSMLQSLAIIADSAFAPATARVAALRSLATVMPNVAANDPSLLPESEFFLRRLEDVGNSLVGPLNAASETPNLGNAIIRIGSDSLAAIAAASKNFIISVSQAAPTGPAYLSKAVKTALAPAQFQADGPCVKNAARMAGAFMLFGETSPRPLVGSRVTLTIPTTYSVDLDAFMQHSGMSGLLIARRNKVGFDVERLERDRLALRGSTAESQLRDSFPTSLRIFGASIEDEATTAYPVTEESSPEVARTPSTRPPESPDASPTTAERLAEVDVVDVSAPPADRGRILDPLEALVRGLMDQEDDDNEDDEEGALGSLGAQLQALTDFVDGRRGVEDSENVEDENEDDGDALEEFGLPARAHRQVFGIRHPNIPTPSLRITNVSLRQRLRRLSEPNADRNITQVPPPPHADTSPRSRTVRFKEPSARVSASSGETHTDYMVAVAIPKDPTVSMGKDAILQRSGNQYEVCCVPASLVSPATEHFTSSGMAAFALHDDKDHVLVDYASFLVNAVATVLRNTKIPTLPSPIADVPLLGQDRTIESQHDHPVGVSTYQTLQFPGATRITISFSKNCATDPSAYLRFYKSDGHSTYWGLAKYTGTAGSSCWNQDLVIPSDTVIVHFNSEESSNSAWGYALKVKPGFNKNWYSYIPPLAPSAVHSVILTSAAIRALDSLLTSPMKYMFARACVSTLAAPSRVGFLNTLTRVYADCQAIIENHDDRVRHWQRAVTAPVVRESLHDYANNTNETEMIEVPGATSLIVTFDAQSVTEEGHDYLAFFLDAECNRRVPGSEEKYSGSGNRWPGVADSEPLRIPYSRFWYRWVNDGSHTYWGWRMTVTPIVPSHLDDLNCGNVHRADALCALMAASPALIPRSEDSTSFLQTSDFFNSDSKVPKSDEVGELDFEMGVRRAPQREPLSLIAGADTLSKSSSPGRRWEVTHSVDVHAMPSLSSACIASLSRGTVVVELSQSGCWIAHEQGWSLAKSRSTSLLRLLPRSPINLAARVYGYQVQTQDKVASGLSIVALNAPAHANLRMTSQSSFAFEAVVLQAGSLHALGFTLSRSSTSMEKVLSSWQSQLEDNAKHRVSSSNPGPGPACVKSAGAKCLEDDDFPTTNDEGAPAIPSQHIDGLWYCGTRLGTETTQHSSGQCGPNDGVPCSSCARYTRARHASIAEKAARQSFASCSVTLRMRLQSGNTGTGSRYRQLSPADSSGELATEPRRSGSNLLQLVDVANSNSSVWRLLPTAAQVCCVNGHDLSPVEWRETFTCNGISEPCWWCRFPAGGPSSPSIRWECARCNFHYCHACYESKLRQPAYKIAVASDEGTMSYICARGDGVALEPNREEIGEHHLAGPTTWTLLPGFTSCTYALALSQHPTQQRVLCYDGDELRMKSLLEIQPQEEVSWQIEPVNDEEAGSSIPAEPATMLRFGGEAVRDFGFVGYFGTVSASDVFSFRLDFANRQCRILRNGSHVQCSTIAAAAPCDESLKVVPAFISGSTEAHGILLAWNFGQQPFRYCADDTPLIGALSHTLEDLGRGSHQEVRTARSVFTFSCYNRQIDTSSEPQMKERVLGPPKVRGGERNTWDPASIDAANVTLEDGNLRVVATYSRSDRGNRNHVIRARHGYSKARHRWKITCIQREGEGSGHLLGVCRGNAQTTFLQHNCGEGFYGILLNGNNKVSGRGRQNYGRFSHDVGTVYGVDLDLERGTLSFTCNGTDHGVAFTGLGGVFFPALAVGTIESTTYVADFSGANLPLRIESEMLEFCACSADILMHYTESPVQGLATVGPDWTSDPSKNPLYACARSDDSRVSEEQPSSRALCLDLHHAHPQSCITPLPCLLESGVGSVRVAAATLATRHLLTITQLSVQSVLRSLMTTWPTATRPASWGSTRAFLNALVISVGTASSLEHWPGHQGKGTKGLRAKLLNRTYISAEQDEDTCAAFVRHVVSTYTSFVSCSTITGGVSFSVTPHVVNVGHDSIQPSLVARVPPLPPSVSGEISTSTLPVGDAIAVLDHATICHTLADGTSRSVNSYRASVNQSSSCYWYSDYSNELPADRRSLMPVYPERDLAGGVNAVLRRCSGWVSFLRYMGADAVENDAKSNNLMTDACTQVQVPTTAVSQSSHATASLCMETLALVMQALNSRNCALRFLEKDEGAYLLSALSEFVVRAENLQLVESLHGITQALRTIASLEPGSVPAIHSQLHWLESALVSRTNARIQAEIGSNRKSVLLQMLVEAALAAYAAVRRLPLSVESNKNVCERSTVIGGMTESKGESDQGHAFPIWSEVGLDPRLELMQMKSEVQFKSSSGGMREEIIEVEVPTVRVVAFLKATDDCFVISGDRNAVTLHESALAVVAEEDVRVRTRGSFSPDTYVCEVNRVEARVEAGGTLVVWFEAQGDGIYGSFLDIDVPCSSVLTVGGTVINTEATATYSTRESTAVRGSITWTGVGVDRLLDQRKVEFCFLGVYAQCTLSIPCLSPFSAANLNVTDRLVGIDNDSVHEFDLSSSDELEDVLQQRVENLEDKNSKLTFFFARTQPVSRQSFATVHGARTVPSGPHSRRHSWRIKMRHAGGTVIVGVDSSREDEANAANTPVGMVSGVGLGSDGILRACGKEVPFGPVLMAGDFIDVVVDFVDGTVAFWWNGCKIGIGVGPADTQAAIIVSSLPSALGAGEVSIAASLCAAGDAVVLKHDGLAVDSGAPNVGHEPASRKFIIPGWLEEASLVEKLLSDIDAQHADDTLPFASPAGDAAIVEWLDRRSTTQTDEHLRKGSWSAAWISIKPTDDQLIAAPPALRLMNSQATSHDIEARLAVIDRINRALERILPLMPWGLQMPLAAAAARHRRLVYAAKKKALLDECVHATISLPDSANSNLANVELVRQDIADRVERRECDEEGKWSTFGRAFRVLTESKLLSYFRKSGRLFRVQLRGEHALDDGGPYREMLSTFASELQSKTLPLLIQTPNAVADTGENRDRYIVRPGAAANPTHRSMLEFFGRLMGFSLRNGEFLALSLAPVVWKILVDEPLDEVNDLASVDKYTTDALNVISSCTRDEFDRSFTGLYFTYPSADNSEPNFLELVPDGENKEVMYENRDEFVRAALAMRVAELKEAVVPVRIGLAQTVPQIVLSLYTGRQLETKICGEVTIDLQLLKRCTVYEDGYSESDRHVTDFWQILEEMDHTERANFLRFTWGRTRLPLTVAEFPDKFKIARLPPARGPVDTYLPSASTCHFKLYLPPYSNRDVMRAKLRQAIHDCHDIDNDV